MFNDVEGQREVRGVRPPKQRSPGLQPNYAIPWGQSEMDSDIYDYAQRNWRGDRHITRVPAYPPVIKNIEDPVTIDTYTRWRTSWCIWKSETILVTSI